MEQPDTPLWSNAPLFVQYISAHPEAAQIADRIKSCCQVHKTNLSTSTPPTSDLINRSTIATMQAALKALCESRSCKFNDLFADASKAIRECAHTREAVSRTIQKYGLPVAFAAVSCGNPYCFDYNFPGCFVDVDSTGKSDRMNLSMPLYNRSPMAIAKSPPIPFCETRFSEWVFNSLTQKSFGKCCEEALAAVRSMKIAQSQKALLQVFEQPQPATMLYTHRLQDAIRRPKRKQTPTDAASEAQPDCDEEETTRNELPPEDTQAQKIQYIEQPATPAPTPQVQLVRPQTTPQHTSTECTLWTQAHETPFQTMPRMTQLELSEILNTPIPHHMFPPPPQPTPAPGVHTHRDLAKKVRAILCKQFIDRASLPNSPITSQSPIDIITSLQRFFQHLESVDADPMKALMDSYAHIDNISEDAITAFAEMARALLQQVSKRSA